ncbi:unnamed protein product [Rotaria socialis]|uniref:Uncharacterized protein n=1 Tax=Rotaria socialis TaxID=392032 RepID=A0A818U3H5_9BILA|nr:unnamed protein product [Rotaria socialis]CAF3328874.1 unnamed protein product [Rotaria socialis]CAF3445612.1 unnamed protein product [Rotaria socialis]CAF3597208.1 unnamed protein product [Rotaria socialis]CAF3691779.1 unnamed protein product [Rotaria socialis]
MDCPNSTVENVLERALRTYEESERSLKSICNSVEQENNELEEEFKSLQAHQTTLIKQYHLIKESLHQIRGEHARLAERQLVIDQQTNQIHQRYEQVKKALKKIVSAATLTNEDFSDETFSMLGFKLIRIDEERRLTNDIGTDYDPPTCLSTKRKLNNQNKEFISTEYNHKHHKNNSSVQRSSK